MTSRARFVLLVACGAFVAALLGVSAGQRLFPLRPQGMDVHQVLHDRLRLDDRQDAAIHGLEADYHAHRAVLERQLTAANRAIADAMRRERRDGPLVDAAVDRSHAIMGKLQKESLAHVFAMRAQMRPDQVRQFDAIVEEALTTGGP